MIPVRLNNSNVAECVKYDVYFNGKKQSQCTVADAQHGYIERYKSVFGVRAMRHGKPVVERLTGKVQIVPRGQALPVESQS